MALLPTTAKQEMINKAMNPFVAWAEGNYRIVVVHVSGVDIDAEDLIYTELALEGEVADFHYRNFAVEECIGKDAMGNDIWERVMGDAEIIYRLASALLAKDGFEPKKIPVWNDNSTFMRKFMRVE